MREREEKRREIGWLVGILWHIKLCGYLMPNLVFIFI